MLKNKAFLICSITIILIVLIIFIPNIISKNKYSRNDVIDLVANSNAPNNIYIENNIYENNSYCGFAKYYIKDNIEYIYQENANQEKVEIYINSEDNTSTTVLHAEKNIVQNNYTDNNSEVLPEKNNLLDQLNNTTYQYKYCGDEMVDEINCIKISLISDENNECNYYIDKNSGYIVKTENNNLTETYKYNINAVTDENLKMFNIDNYSDYTFVNGIQ